MKGKRFTPPDPTQPLYRLSRQFSERWWGSCRVCLSSKRRPYESREAFFRWWDFHIDHPHHHENAAALELGIWPLPRGEHLDPEALVSQ